MFKERQLASQGQTPDWFPEWKKKQIDEVTRQVHVFCCRKMDDGSIIVPTGLVPSLRKLSIDEKFNIEIKDTREFDSFNRRNLVGEKPRELRKPQKLAIEAIMNPASDQLNGVGLIEMATGIGKTAYAQELIRGLGHKAIFLVPSRSILNQTIKRYEDAFGEKNVKKYGDGKKNIGFITVATYQSVYGGDPEDFADIDVAIFDEVHHVAAETFYDVAMNKLKNASYRIGLTAYKERADGSTMLIEAACGPVSYSYTAAEAIADGYLAKPTFIIYSVTETSGKWTKYKINKQTNKREAVKTLPCIEYDGDDDIEAYRNWILGNDKLNSFVANMTNQFVSEGKSVLILVDEKEHGDRLCQLIPDAGYAIGGGKDNDLLQKNFNSRTMKVLIGTSTLGEGADTVPVDVLIELQGGASASKTIQADGRALRNDPDENGVPRKPTTLIIDFDFPKCKYLHNQSEKRIKVHKLIGPINRTNMLK
jgi:superfamily II DNA or RNA helicase